MIDSTITGQTTTSVIAPAVARMIEPDPQPDEAVQREEHHRPDDGPRLRAPRQGHVRARDVMIALPMAYENTVAMTPTTKAVAVTTSALAAMHPRAAGLRGERHPDGGVPELLADDQDAEHADQEVADRGAGEQQAEPVLLARRRCSARWP